MLPQGISIHDKGYQWGCEHEDGACGLYKVLRQLDHANFSISTSGFCISTQHPYIGASPDGFVTCDCCGVGIL
ncbi:hypothetical protein LSH36_1521g00006 [Paralvinella palmiformis]|uniref:Uncharacterized protein n=1 Tax=Paralvinella palmiformis TaxID=53620 RepID=A0AAD9MMU1_9ANNE|nr:hypothetical protein LSH36_1521g00006 [Paralvinella palmiformis]